MPTVRIVGVGRAGGALALALGAAGVDVDPVPRPVDDAGRERVRAAAHGVDVVLLCVPDGSVAEVAAQVRPGPAVVAHGAGSLGLDALAPHAARASVHPVVSLPSPEVGARRLRGAWFAVDGSDDRSLGAVEGLVGRLGGRSVRVRDAERATHHAAAVVASNHLVALLGQVERLARSIGVPPAAYLELARGAVDNVAELGAAAALTGPVARGDWGTVRRHLAALPAEERDAYLALAAAAAVLAGRDVPADLRPEDAPGPAAGADGVVR